MSVERRLEHVLSNLPGDVRAKIAATQQRVTVQAETIDELRRKLQAIEKLCDYEYGPGVEAELLAEKLRSILTTTEG